MCIVIPLYWVIRLLDGHTHWCFSCPRALEDDVDMFLNNARSIRMKIPSKQFSKEKPFYTLILRHWLFKNTTAEVTELRRWHRLCGLSCSITTLGGEQWPLMYIPHSILSTEATSATHTYIHRNSPSHWFHNYFIIHHMDAVVIHSVQWQHSSVIQLIFCFNLRLSSK